jgi:hypothetical protein
MIEISHRERLMKKKLTTISISTLLSVSAVAAEEIQLNPNCLRSSAGVAEVISQLQVTTDIREILLGKLETVRTNDDGEFIPVLGTTARDTGWTPVVGSEARETGWTPVVGSGARETGWTPVVKDDARIAEILKEAMENSSREKIEELLLLNQGRKNKEQPCVSIQVTDED